MSRKILVMGLPGSGKTTLCKLLARRLNAVHFNNDEVRANLNKDLGFSLEDRLEQARRMGFLCDLVVRSGGTAIGDFICPTPQTRAAFGDAYIIWVDRIAAGRFEDTNRLFVPPENYDFRVEADGSPEYWVERIMRQLRPVFDPKKPTGLFVGRFQPFHDGHLKLIEEGLRRVGQVCIAVRDTHGVDDGNPLTYAEVKARIETALAIHAGRFDIVPLPNVSHIFFGRDVGYAIERLDLDEAIHAISATEIRQKSGLVSE